MTDNPPPDSRLAITSDQRDRYRDAIEELGASTPCARCGADFKHFGVFPALSPINLFDLSEAVKGIREQQVLTVVLMCTKCGAIYFHSVGLLDKSIRGSEDSNG